MHGTCDCADAWRAGRHAARYSGHTLDKVTSCSSFGPYGPLSFWHQPFCKQTKQNQFRSTAGAAHQQGCAQAHMACISSQAHGSQLLVPCLDAVFVHWGDGCPPHRACPFHGMRLDLARRISFSILEVSSPVWRSVALTADPWRMNRWPFEDARTQDVHGEMT